MTTHGTIGPFEQGRKDWTLYTERLEQYFTANGVDDQGKCWALLLSVCGAPTYQVIRNLAAPEKPTNLSIKEIIGLVRDHYCPPPSEIVQRFLFNTSSQKEAETIADFVADPCRISEHCKFGDTLDQMLQDRLVCGIRDGRIQKRLLTEPELTFRKAFDSCQANAHNLRQASQKFLPAPIMSLKEDDHPTPAMASARLQHWAMTLRAYNYTITYKPGSQHGNADLLSRLLLPCDIKTETLTGESILLVQSLSSSPVTEEQMKLLTDRDPILSRVKEMVLTGCFTTDGGNDDLKPFQRRREELSLYDGCILWGNRVVVCTKARQCILTEIHEGHPGISWMKGVARHR